MTYENELKWQALSKFTIGYSNGLTDEQILSTWDNFPGTLEEKKSLLEECKAYVFLRTAFTSRSFDSRDVAIKLANKYINNSKNHINLIKEELVAFYIEMGRYEEAENLINELIEQELKNMRNIAKKIVILKSTEREEEALQILEEGKHKPSYRSNPEIFELHFNILKKLGRTEELTKLARRAQELELGDDIKLRKKRRLKLKENLQYLQSLNLEDDSVKKAIATLDTTIKREGKISRELKRGIEQNQEGTSELILKDTYIDSELIRKINHLLTLDKEEINLEKAHEMADKIKNLVVKTITKYQIDYAYGLIDRDIIIGRTRAFIRDNKESLKPDEKEILEKKFLKNFLISKDSLFYKHSKWIDFQKNFAKLYSANKIPDSKGNER